MNVSLRSFLAAILVAFLFAPLAARAEVKLGRYFSDNMIVQRDKPTAVRGSADAGAEVTVEFAGQKKSATADETGNWTVTLDPMPASAEPRSLVASSAGKSATINNVLVGDVLLVAKQTSIDLTVASDEQAKAQLATFTPSPTLRVIRIATVPAAKPQADLVEAATAGWSPLDKDAAMSMSASAFYLGRDLAASVDVPVGIIDLNMGAAFPVSWLSREALEDTENFYGKGDVPGQLQRFDRALDAISKGEPLNKKDVLTPGMVVEHPMFPAGGFNGVIAPLQGLGLKAVLLQLGNDYPYMIYASLEKNGTQFDRDELNRAYVQTYDIRKVGCRMEPVTLPRVPRIWRAALGEPNLPIAFIAPPGSALRTLGEHHREMRELQRQIAEQNPNVGLILPGSDNVAFSAQPKDHSLVAQRALAWVQAAIYAKPGAIATGPMFDRVDANFNEATIHFKPGTAVGLKALERGLDDFEAAGVEGDYEPVNATIDGETIRIRSDTIDRITRVRYNWNSRPNQALVNAAGLPAMPFRSEQANYDWFVTNEDDDLPSEYSTPANTWEQNDVTLINGQMKTHGYDNFSGWVGPVGIKTGPFGPNMGVREIKPGAPAEGKLFKEDMIYSANGTMLGDRAWEVMASAITHSETREGNGKLVLGVRRDGTNLDVEITLPVLGTYSPNAPFDCPKTETIIANLEKWLVADGADAGFLNYDAIFLLANGKPELQGYVRRIVYEKLAQIDVTKSIEPTKAGKSWFNSADAYLLGEYYLATGDRNVLPALKYYCDRLAATQHPEWGGWRHNFPGGDGYGLIPNAGLPGMMGMYFAKEAGLDINERAYHLGLKHFGTNRAETGHLIYGTGDLQRYVPLPFDPAELAAGKLSTSNGGLSSAGILMRFAGNYRAAHLCSMISAYAWNNTFDGHGGNFWNNFWTPLGANDHGKEAFVNFWHNYQWYRELNRMFDGSIIQHEDGKSGAACGVALVAPRKRIQIVGAPTSPFSVRAPEALSPAIEAYRNKDYAGCEKLVAELIAGGTIAKDDLPTVEYLARAAKEMRESIDADLKRMSDLVAAGNAAEARTFLTSLKAVIPADDARLASVEAAIADAKPTAVTKGGRKKNSDAPADAAALTAMQDAAAAAKAAGDPAREWECLVTEIATDRAKPKKGDLGKVPADQANLWRMLVVEDLSQAPTGWTAPDFDDSTWGKTNLPISWRMYHTALLRTTFDVKDKDAFDGLRLRGWLFRQQGIEVYLNGELIARINNLESKTGDVEAELKASAIKHLKNGTNTFAVTTRHNWRWGMLSMHVYNDGFGFRLDARKK